MATADNLSAKAVIQDTLAEFGLGHLAPRLWGDYLAGKPIDLIFTELRATPEYKARFPGMDTLRSRGRAISEREYISLERTYAQIFKQSGLPSGFYDAPEDFGRLIAGEVSPAEVASRVQMASVAAFRSPPELRDELNRLYGIGAGELTAYFIDPDKALPLIEQQFVAGQIGASARRAGFGTLTRDEAERLADLGLTEDQATGGFGQLAADRELFSALPGQRQPDIGRDVQLAAAFEGDADAQEVIKRRRRERLAEFQSGGGFAGTREGVTGIGSA